MNGFDAYCITCGTIILSTNDLDRAHDAADDHAKATNRQGQMHRVTVWEVK